MAKYKIVGSRYRKGVSKKGNPYEADILQCVSLDSVSRRSEDSGVTVKEIFVSRGSGLLCELPKPDSIVEIYFNDFGFPERIDFLE